MSILFYQRAKKELSKLPVKIQRNIGAVIDKMQRNILELAIVKLQNCDNLYRLHIGRDYVIVFTRVAEDIVIVRIADRKEVYRNIPALVRIAKDLRE